MNGLLNIQVRVQAREARTVLKQLEKDVYAVDKSLSAQARNTRVLSSAQANARNQTRALGAAERELAAASRAVAAAQKAQAAATGAIAAKEAAYQTKLMATHKAAMQVQKLSRGSIQRRAAEQRATDKLTASEERLSKARLSQKTIKTTALRAKQTMIADPSQPNIDAAKATARRLAKANIELTASERAVQRARLGSIQSLAVARNAEEALSVARMNLTRLQASALVSADELTAAHARVAAAELEQVAADERLIVSQTALTGAEERAAVGAQAMAKATVTAGAAAGGAAGGFGRGLKSMRNFANQAQWAGRQMQTNFTLPIMLAGGFAIKFALDNEKAMTKLQKVYGDNTKSAEEYKKETEALGISMRLLSEKFGVQQSDVIEIGAAWAAAGAQGKTLAQGVSQTLRTMVVGELDATEATKALISIQAQWGESSDELAATMNMLNTVENQSAVNLKDLVDAYARASGSARNAGVTQEQLAVDIAALVPAAGSAAAAGNGLKTIYSKLIAPTQDAVDIMHELGVETNKASWNNLTASDRLGVLAEAYKTATRGQRGQADATIFGRYQLNRASVLMDAIAQKEGNRAKLLKQITSATNNQKIADQELQKVMESNPQKLKQLGVIAQNMAADVGTKLVPALMAVASILTSVFRAFNKLDPTVRKAIAGFLIFLAVIGPLMRWTMGLAVLIGWLGTAFLGLGKAGIFLARGSIWLLIAPFKMLSSFLTLIARQVVIVGRMILLLPRAFAVARTGVIVAALGIQAAIVGIRTAIMVTSRLVMALPWAFAAARGAIIVSLAAIRGAIVAFYASVRAFVIFMWAVSGSITAMAVSLKAIPLMLAKVRGAIVAFYGTMRALAISIAALPVLTSAAMTSFLAVMRGGLAAASSMLLGWPALLIATVAIALYAFRDQIGQLFSTFGDQFSKVGGLFQTIGNQIVGVFNMLPNGIQNAMLAVVRVVRAAVMAVYQLFSYLNPFAHHSPSLVENVTQGMAIVMSEFGKLPAISGPINKAYADIKRFKEVTRGMMDGLDSIKRAEDLKNLLTYVPQAAGAFRTLVKDLTAMEPVLVTLESAMNRQQKVVDSWKAKVDAANDTLDRQNEVLDHLQKSADGWSAKLEEAQSRLSNFADAPIQGMRAMEDAIFANSMAQKQLQLQMMNMEDAVGPIDDLQNKLASLAGDIENLRGEQSDLRSAGAGSDILNEYDAQIQSLEDQQTSITDTASAYDDLKNQLDALERAGQRLDLVQALNFDGLQRQIQQASQSMTEMPFDQIIAGVQQAKTDVDKYQQQLDIANQRVKEQQTVVDAASAAYDALNKRYEREQKQLDAITQKYEDMRDAIQEVKSALDDISGAASSAIQAGIKKKKGASGGGAGDYVSPAVQNFRDAASGDFPVQGGTSGIGGPGNLKDIEQFNKDLAGEMKGLTDSLDVFAPIKKYWGKFTSWWGSTVTPGFKGLFKQVVPGSDDLSPLFGAKIRYEDTPFYSAIKSFGPKTKELIGGDKASSAMDGIGVGFQKAGALIMSVVRLIGPDIKGIFVDLIAKAVKAWQTWRPEVEKLVESLKRFWDAIQPLVMLIGGVLLLVLKVAASILRETLGRALDFIIDIIGDLLQVFAGLLDFVSFILTGDLSAAWSAIVNIFSGAFQAIYHIFEGAISLVYGIVKGFVMGIVNFFIWLWDELVGHSIIPDMVNAIVAWFLGMPGKILNALLGLGSKLVDLIQAAWALFMSALRTAWSGTYEFIKSLPQRIYDGFMSAVGLITSIGSKIVRFIKDGLVAEWSAVSGWVGEKVNWVVDKFTGIKDRMARGFVGMFDGIKDAFKSAINTIIGWWNNLSLTIDIPNKIPGLPDSFSIDTPNVGYLAKGGVAKSGQMYVVGEVGPEFFIPGSSGRVTSNSDIAAMMSAAVQDAFSTLRSVPLSGTVKGINLGALTGAVAQADARAAGASTTQPAVQNTTVHNNVEYHFHGDLSFPNIKSGEDAEQFLTNLSDLAG